jgi:hypothetical protein
MTHGSRRLRIEIPIAILLHSRGPLDSLTGPLVMDEGAKSDRSLDSGRYEEEWLHIKQLKS